MEFSLDRVRDNVRAASTEDLLDRATYFRAGMEPEALELVEQELRRRGVSEEEFRAWGPREGDQTILLPDGTAARCSFCRRPAVEEEWGWHKLWGLLPLFPRRVRYCKDHAAGR